MLHDSRVYENANEFNPEHFLKDGKLDPDVLEPMEVMFGFGRRCVPKASLDFLLSLRMQCTVYALEGILQIQCCSSTSHPSYIPSILHPH